MDSTVGPLRGSSEGKRTNNRGQGKNNANKIPKRFLCFILLSRNSKIMKAPKIDSANRRRHHIYRRFPAIPLYPMAFFWFYWIPAETCLNGLDFRVCRRRRWPPNPGQASSLPIALTLYHINMYNTSLVLFRWVLK